MDTIFVDTTAMLDKRLEKLILRRAINLLDCFLRMVD